MNYSEVDCLGLVVQHSGLDTVLCPRVITASHFSSLALLMFIISRKKQTTDNRLVSVYTSLLTHGQSQIRSVFNILEDKTVDRGGHIFIFIQT